MDAFPRGLGFLLPVLVLAVLHPATGARAQSIVGRVVEEGSGAPIQGAVVVLLDAGGDQRTGTLTSDDGGFTLRAPAPGSYRIRAQRIGFRDGFSPPLDLVAGESLRYELVIPATAVRLEGIVAEGRRRCELRPEEGRPTQTLWEEARKALDASRWTAAERRLQFRLTRYEREMEPGSLTPRKESVREEIASRSTPFRSLPAADLEREGYIRSAPDGVVYYAPDAEVLLSEAFLDAHCFRIQQDDAAPERVGLAFEPLKGRRTPDIRGVLWMDRASAELRFLEYTYTGHRAPASADQVGGRVEFERLPTGAWIVKRWYIRMPRVEEREMHVPGSENRIRRASLAGIVEEGGEVTEVLGPGSARRERLRAEIRGRVSDLSAGARPLAGATVVLLEAGLSARSDSLGHFSLRGAPPGDFRIRFEHPRLRRLGLEPPESQIRVEGAVAEADLSIPADAAGGAHARLCPAVGTRAGAIAGFARGAAGRPAAGATVHARWTWYVAGAGTLQEQRAESSALTDTDGFFVLCGVRAGTRASIWLDGWPEDVRSIDVVADEVAELDLRSDHDAARAELDPHPGR